MKSASNLPSLDGPSHPGRAAPLWRLAQEWLRPALGPGKRAVDATCGNGGDTLFLAAASGPRGLVLGIDIQEAAIRRTRENLHSHGLAADLVCGDHGTLDAVLEERNFAPVDAAIFNLGYLPKGDHAIRTAPRTTCAAIRAILQRAAPLFRLAVVAYRGHCGGAPEARAVEDFLRGETDASFSLLVREGSNRETGPVFFAVGRGRAGKAA